MNDVNHRAEAVMEQRRRRGDNYRGYDLRLEVPEHLKDPNYTYRWINDEKGRLQQRTTQDDWDFVDGKELSIASHTDDKNNNEADGRIRREVTSSTTSRPIFAYLCKKRKDYHEADFRKEMAMNKARQNQTIRTQEAPDADGGLGKDDPNHAYIPREIQAAVGRTEAQIRRAGKRGA